MPLNGMRDEFYNEIHIFYFQKIKMKTSDAI